MPGMSGVYEGNIVRFPERGKVSESCLNKGRKERGLVQRYLPLGELKAG